MNFELFIAKRIAISAKYKSSVSSPIIKIAIGVIALGIVMMLLSIATGLGLKRKIRDKVSGFNGHVVISNFDVNNTNSVQKPITTVQKFYPDFEQVEGVKHIQTFISRPGIIRTEKGFEGVILKGVGVEYDWSFLSNYLINGNIPTITSKRSSDVLISKNIAKKLFFKVGDKFDTFFVKEKNSLPSRRVFTVAGIYDTGFEEFDSNLMVGDIKHLQHLNKWEENQVGGFEIFLDNFDDIGEKSREIYMEIPADLDSRSIFEIYPQIFEWLKLFDGNIAIVIIIMILVSGINMITALLVLILERTQLIGVLKTMGTSSLSVRKVFLYNATYIISRGLIIGNIIGLLVIFLQYQFKIIELDSASYYVNYAPVYINIWHILFLNLGTILLCILMLWLPSIIITKISPARSVKFS